MSSRLEIVEIVPGIWSVRRGRRASNVYIVKTSPGAVLVDAGPDETGADVMMGLQKARVGLRSLRAILLTHGHRHAIAGARALRERSGAPVLCPERDSTTAPPAPDACLAGVDAVENLFEVVATPGHTRAHVSLLFRPGRILFAGDALVVERGVLRLSSELEVPEAAPASMERCLSLEPALFLPAHGPPLSASFLSRRRGR